MANENKDIGDIVKKCKILLLDIEGTTTSISFVKDKLFPYAEENVKKFLESEWESDDVKEAVTALRKLALEDKENSVEGLVAIPGEEATKEDQIEGLVNNVKWQMSSDRKVGALKQLQGLIWKQGYDKGDIKGHVYDDVCAALENWHSMDGQKIYIYSSGSVQAQKLLFGQSLAGDLLKYIDGHFDTAVGAKQESTSYTTIVEKVGCKAEDILFLTDIVKEAEAARKAGLHVALVSREGNAPLTSEATEAFAVIHSLAQLTVSNKRKTDPQEEQPAKVPKTDLNNDVKTESELVEKEGSAPVETEKMEVEESKPETENSNKENCEKPIANANKEVADTKVIETTNATKLDVTEVVTDSNVDKKESTEVMETDSTENVKDNVEETKKAENEVGSIDTENKTDKESIVPKEDSEIKNNEETASIAKETPSTVITEIEDISDKENLTEMAEIIEDLQPIVEEPNAGEDIEELQNVGEVLEKECDEILSKVQDVTNLDSIPLKPILNPIIEESMETENTDSNDIVDSILETEIELENRQNDKSSEKTVTEQVSITDVAAVNSDKVEETSDVTKEKADKTEEKTECPVENTESTSIKDNNCITETSTESDGKVESKDNVEIKQRSETDSSSQDKEPVQSNDTKVKTAVEASAKPEDKPSEIVSETKEDATNDIKPTENSTEESQVNGKTNGVSDTTINQNGDTKNDDDLSSRLTVENGKEINGSNGDSVDAENGKEEKKDVEISDIKVKTVTTEEPRNELIEQPTEA